MNIISGGMNPGVSHPIQAPQQMPMNHVMHPGQPMGMPMASGMTSHPLHTLGGGIHMQQPTVMGGQQATHMQILHGNQMVQAIPSNPQPMNVIEEVDPITRAKSLLPQLKETLAATNSEVVKYVNSLNDSEGGSNHPQMEQSLQDFCNTCDQIELNLKLVAEVLHHNAESRRNFPYNVQDVPTSGQPMENMMQYQQYSNLVEAQVVYAQELKDLLLLRSRKSKDQTSQLHPSSE